MKNHFKKFLFLVCILAHTHACTSAYANAYTPASTHEVNAAEYCKFLNQTAATDPNHLFEQKMSTDPEAACIVRLGTPGRWHYEVITGRENFPMVYVNEVCAAAYCAEMQCEDNEDAADPVLTSNQNSFFVAINNSCA